MTLAFLASVTDRTVRLCKVETGLKTQMPISEAVMPTVFYFSYSNWGSLTWGNDAR